jgi:CHAT domain-containing protein
MLASKRLNIFTNAARLIASYAFRGPMRSLSDVLIVILAALVEAATLDLARAQSADVLDRYSAQREAFVDGFRISGHQDPTQLAALTSGLAELARGSSGELRARALVELGTAQRMGNDFQDAITTYSKAAAIAETLGLRDVAFSAWLGIARAHEYGTSNHGAAAIALERAVDAAGEQPTPKEALELAGYRGELEIGRGDLEAGIIDELRAIDFATDPKDRFYAERDLGDGLTSLVQSCDYRPLVDAESSKEDPQSYAACLRAITAAQRAYERAEATATGLGWTHMAGFVRQSQHEVQNRRQIIQIHVNTNVVVDRVPFHPRSPSDVLVGTTFEAGASTLADAPVLAKLIDAVLSETDPKAGAPNARSQYLRGLMADISGDGPTKAAAFYAAAASIIGAERRGFFDPRRRGTVIENRGEMFESLALRLLTLGRQADAFATFESVRARGLSELAGVLALPDVTLGERAWLADLLVLDARASAIERQLVADLVAHGTLNNPTVRLAELDRLRADRRAKLGSNEPARTRFSADRAMRTASLEGLQKAASASRTAVLLYWSTSTNVIAWYVAADGSDVRAVFLPARVLEQKVGSVLASSRTPSNPFDETTARELFLYLLSPFAERLNSDAVSEIMIVPHGPLVSLPFEALIDPSNGAFVVDRWAVSYAPNATMALEALRRDKRAVTSTVALVDQIIDDLTNETEGIKASGTRLERMTRGALFAGAWKADGLHILTHGEFNSGEALLSSLAGTRSGDAKILAAELPALPLKDVRLAVLSACKGGQIGERISGELYGFPWALLASGVASTVLSRWDVNGASNGRWMTVFYREIAKRSSTATAAAVAMREMRKQGTTHPFYWAAMQVSGR